MSYIKYDKNMAESFQDSLNEQVKKLTQVLIDIEVLCNSSVKKVNYRDELNDFKSCADELKQKCKSIKVGCLKSLSDIAVAVNTINILIDEFDRSENFTLVEAFSDDDNIKVIIDEETNQEIIYFVDKDGNEVSMSDLLNALYTHSGITMNSMVEAAIMSEDDGYELGESIQKEIFDNVNSLVGEAKASEVFGIVSKEDILDVEAQLSERDNYNSILLQRDKNFFAVDGVGGTTAPECGVRKDMLEAYILEDIPSSSEEYKYSKIIDSLIKSENKIAIEGTPPLEDRRFGIEGTPPLEDKRFGIEGTPPLEDRRFGIEGTPPLEDKRFGIEGTPPLEDKRFGIEGTPPLEDRRFGIEGTPPLEDKRFGIEGTPPLEDKRFGIEGTPPLEDRRFGIEGTPPLEDRRFGIEGTPPLEDKRFGIEGTPPLEDKRFGIEGTPPLEDKRFGIEGTPHLENQNIDMKPDDFDNLNKLEDVRIKIRDNYDELAREKFESLGEEAISERRMGMVNRADELYRMEDRTQLREELTRYGYKFDEIEQIIKDPDATISALVEGDQRNQIAEYARDFAETDGVLDFGSDNQRVQQARTEYFNNRDAYKAISEDLNTSVGDINDALDKIENIKNSNYGSYDEWTEDAVSEYSSAVQQYKASMNDYNVKLESLKNAETNYETAYENYNNAKEQIIRQCNPNYEISKNLVKASEFSGNTGRINEINGFSSTEEVNEYNFRENAISGVVLGPDGNRLTGEPILKGLEEKIPVASRNSVEKIIEEKLYADQNKGIETKLNDLNRSGKSNTYFNVKDDENNLTIKDQKSINNISVSSNDYFDIKSNGVGTGKIMNSGYKKNVPIISDEPFVNVPASGNSDSFVEYELSDAVENLDVPILIQPEIKQDIVSTYTELMPELIQREVRFDQMHGNYINESKLEE